MTPTDIRDTAIPEDVMEAARGFLMSDPADYISHKTALNAIARAIMAATEAERERCAKIAEDERWRTDAPPLDGTIIYRRVIQPYRFKPYMPNSQQAKRGEKGRWQMMNEHGGWDNCPHPLGSEWTVNDPFAAKGASHD